MATHLGIEEKLFCYFATVTVQWCHAILQAEVSSVAIHSLLRSEGFVIDRSAKLWKTVLSYDRQPSL
jgi:hypothetical protein